MFSDIYCGKKNFEVIRKLCVNQIGLGIEESLEREKKGFSRRRAPGKTIAEMLEDRIMY